MVLDATSSVRGTVGMVLEATGGSQGLPDGIHVNKRGLRDSVKMLFTDWRCAISDVVIMHTVCCFNHA